MGQLVSKKIKKKRIVRLMILMSVTFVLTVFTSCQNAQKPFKALSVESIAKVEIAFPTEGTNSVIVLNGEESQRIVEALNGLTTTGKTMKPIMGPGGKFELQTPMIQKFSSVNRAMIK